METQQVMTEFRLLSSPDWRLDSKPQQHVTSISTKTENRSMLTQFNRWIGGGSWESHQGFMVKQSCIIPERACSRSMLDWYFMGMGQNDYLSPQIITSDSFWGCSGGLQHLFLTDADDQEKNVVARWLLSLHFGYSILSYSNDNR